MSSCIKPTTRFSGTLKSASCRALLNCDTSCPVGMTSNTLRGADNIRRTISACIFFADRITPEVMGRTIRVPTTTAAAEKDANDAKYCAIDG